MKKIGLIFAALMLMFSTAHAKVPTHQLQDMLKQVSEVNSSWKPVIGQNVYTVVNTQGSVICKPNECIPGSKEKSSIIYILLFYNSNKFSTDAGMSPTDPDPEVDDVRAVFQCRDKTCQLVFIDFFAGVELLKTNMSLLLPDTK